MICCKHAVEEFKTEGDSGTHVGYHCHSCQKVTVEKVDMSEKKPFEEAWHRVTRRFLGLEG